MSWELLEGDALAPHTGPFPQRSFLEGWWRYRAAGELLFAGDAPGALAVVVDGGVARCAGEADLTDYHSPVGSAVGTVAESLAALEPGTRFDLDSLPREAAEPLAEALADAGIAVTVTEHHLAMVLTIPDGDRHVDVMNSKQRHEVRRKLSRFTEAAGTPSLATGIGFFPEFTRMLRSAPGEKGEFLEETIEEMFHDLASSVPGARIDALLDGSGTPVATAFGFTDADTYYLYNSAYEPERGALSPGAVLVHLLIEAGIDEGRRRFDFLKGDESYKKRLGAVPRPLFRIEGVV